MTTRTGFAWLGALLAFAALPAAGQTARPGKNAVDVRGQKQDVYFLPAKNAGKSPADAIVFAPGDGGWRGFAIEIGQAMSSWGYDVFGLDTKRYLESFTSGRQTLNEKQITSDMGVIGKWALQGQPRRVVFAGWSEGAGLGVLALVSPDNRKVYRGLAAIGLPDRAVMGWRWADDITYVTKKDPDEPSFDVARYLPAIAPAPFFMVQSTGDEYTSVDRSKQLFGGAREPKLLKFINAKNHRFEGSRDAFYQALREGLDWLARTPQ